MGDMYINNYHFSINSYKDGPPHYVFFAVVLLVLLILLVIVVTTTLLVGEREPINSSVY